MEDKQSIDLELCVPEKLVETAPFEQLLIAIKKSPVPLGKRQLEVLDYIYNRRLIHCLSRHYPIEDLGEFNDHLSLVVHPALAEKIPDQYRDRWGTIQDVLEMQLGSLRSMSSAKVLEDSSSRSVWDALKLHGQMTKTDLQSELQQNCGLEKGHTERLLECLWANGLVVCKPSPNNGEPVFQALPLDKTNIRPTFQGKGNTPEACALW